MTIEKTVDLMMLEMTTLSQSADGDDALDNIKLMRNRIEQSKLIEISARDLTQLIKEVLATSSTRTGSFHQLKKSQSAHRLHSRQKELMISHDQFMGYSDDKIS